MNSGLNTLEITSPFINANRFINSSGHNMANKNVVNGFDLTNKKN